MSDEPCESCGNFRCAWCKHAITRSHVFVQRSVKLSNGEYMLYRYHASPRKPCYAAYLEFLAQQA